MTPATTTTLLVCDSGAPWCARAARAAAHEGIRVLVAASAKDAFDALGAGVVDVVAAERHVSGWPVRHIQASARYCGAGARFVTVDDDGVEGVVPAAAAAAHTLELLRAAATADRKPRVLVADDDGEMRDFLAEALYDEGFAVLEADDGHDGLAVAKHMLEQRPGGAGLDLVVTDLQMPRCDGFELLAGVRALDAALPVIVISAFADEDVCGAGIAAGARAVLAKPFDLERLCALARAAAAERAERAP